MPLGIERIASYLPRTRLSAAELAERYGFDIEFVRDKIGVSYIHVAEEEERASDLAVSAIKALAVDVPDVADRVQALVVCTQTPDFQLPHVSALVQHRAGLRNDVAAFDISLGCSGYVYGLSVLESLMERNGFTSGLLVTTETYSKIIDETDRNTRALFSDAATATLVSDRGTLRAGRYTFGTAGDRHEDLIVRPSIGYSTVGERRLTMNGRGIFDFVIKSVPTDVERCLTLNETRLDDMDLVVFHQASGFMLDMLAKRFKLTNDPRMARTLGEYGNTVSSTIPLTLQRYLKPEMRQVLISGFGVGLSWATTVLKATGGTVE